MRDEPLQFLPARSTDEAIARIYSLTGAQGSASRGEKRAIVALRDVLDLDVEVAATSARMGKAIAEALDVTWLPTYESRNRVSLDGLNALLHGAAQAYHQGALRRLAGGRPPGLEGPEWATFRPARSKIEAVNRISALTGSGPEHLGPGSKEHKRVLINLARALAPELDTSLTKTKLAAAIAERLAAPWTDDCESTGETISLVGLNTLLAGAERRLGRLGEDPAMLLGSPEDEGRALAAALLDHWAPKLQPDGGRRVIWDGRESIEWMRAQGVTSGPNQSEWQGFFLESRGRAVLNSAFAPNPHPPRTTYGRTSFDYSLRYVWDLKAHTESWVDPVTRRRTAGQSASPLNDQEAMESCIAEQGLGFLMVSGDAIADDGSFHAWHSRFKEASGVTSRPSNSGRSRRRKAAFEPRRVDAYFFHDAATLAAAKAAGLITGFAQGSQPPSEAGAKGRARRPKYNLTVSKARADPTVAVGGFEW